MEEEEEEDECEDEEVSFNQLMGAEGYTGFEEGEEEGEDEEEDIFEDDEAFDDMAEKSEQQRLLLEDDESNEATYSSSEGSGQAYEDWIEANPQIKAQLMDADRLVEQEKVRLCRPDRLHYLGNSG